MTFTCCDSVDLISVEERMLLYIKDDHSFHILSKIYIFHRETICFREGIFLHSSVGVYFPVSFSSINFQVAIVVINVRNITVNLIFQAVKYIQ